MSDNNVDMTSAALFDKMTAEFTAHFPDRDIPAAYLESCRRPAGRRRPGNAPRLQHDRLPQLVQRRA
jgi:glycyl-tRNA synthetase alpha subunit